MLVASAGPGPGGRDGVAGRHVGRDSYGNPGQPKKTSASA